MRKFKAGFGNRENEEGFGREHLNTFDGCFINGYQGCKKFSTIGSMFKQHNSNQASLEV